MPVEKYAKTIGEVNRQNAGFNRNNGTGELGNFAEQILKSLGSEYGDLNRPSDFAKFADDTEAQKKLTQKLNNGGADAYVKAISDNANDDMLKALFDSSMLGPVIIKSQGGDAYDIIDRTSKARSLIAPIILDVFYPGAGDYVKFLDPIAEVNNNINKGILQFLGFKKKEDPWKGIPEICKSNHSSANSANRNCAAMAKQFGTNSVQQQVYNILFNLQFNEQSPAYRKLYRNSDWNELFYQLFWNALPNEGAGGSLETDWNHLTWARGEFQSSFQYRIFMAFMWEKGDSFPPDEDVVKFIDYKVRDFINAQRDAKNVSVPDDQPFRYYLISQLATAIQQPTGPNAGQLLILSNFEGFAWLIYYFEACLNQRMYGIKTEPWATAYPGGNFLDAARGQLAYLNILLSNMGKKTELIPNKGSGLVSQKDKNKLYMQIPFIDASF